ncbi:MAG: biotin attachment protein [Burkholderiaceae bacterium]|nr:biotin attachment protein [Burkholderiaceae bacterium]
MIAIGLDNGAWKDVEPGTEALVDRWLVGQGEAVKAGAVLAVVVLVKTSIELTAPAEGTIDRIDVAAGSTFARGVPIGWLRETA